MKNFKFMKRMAIFLLVAVMTLGTVIQASAAENISYDKAMITITDNESGNMVTPLLNNDVSAYIESVAIGGTGAEVATLDSYIGLSKTFNVTLLPHKNGTNSITGYANVIVTKVSTGENIASWTLDLHNQFGEKTFFLPTSGDYRVWVYNGMNTVISIVGYWS